MGGEQRISGEEMMRLAGCVWRAYFSGEKRCREDLVAEGALGIVAGLDKYDPGRGVALTTYMCTCARNAMAMWMKRERKRRQAEVCGGLELVEVQGEFDLERIAQDERVGMAMAQVREASGVLRPRANAIANELLKGRRQIDVAKQFGVTRQNVNNVFKKIKRRITERYEYDGGQLVRKVVRQDGEEAGK